MILLDTQADTASILVEGQIVKVSLADVDIFEDFTIMLFCSIPVVKLLSADGDAYVEDLDNIVAGRLDIPSEPLHINKDKSDCTRPNLK